MDLELPSELADTLAAIDAFIEAEIKPLEQQDDNARFFDHRREFARTDSNAGGVPRPEWEELLGEMRRRADSAGFFRYGMPEELGGKGAGNLVMAVIREHLAAKGLGLHNDLQDESSVVGNMPLVLVLWEFGSDEQRALCEGMIDGSVRVGFGLTEPAHGSDATWLDTTAVRDGDDWIIDGAKRFNTGMHTATHDLVFARTSGQPGSPRGITGFLVPTAAPGLTVPFHWWTFNMPTDHAEVELRGVRVPHEAIVGEEGKGLALALRFVHENRIRQAASGVGAAQYCIDEAVAYANERITFGKPLSTRQAIQWPLVELHTDAAMVRALVRATAWEMDLVEHVKLTDRVSMCNYRANRLVCQAADQAMQTLGGVGYSRHRPFEHIYRHHRRYRITEGSEEIQMRNVAGRLFGFTKG